MDRRAYTRGAFTLIELLVAIAVFALILGVLLSLISSTSSVTNSSQAKMETGAKLRQILDRLSADFRSAVMRKDLAPHFQKAKGNDALYFYVASDGYGGERGVCAIGYRIRDDHLERGAHGADWNTNAVAFAKDLASSDFVTNLANENYDTLGEYVFRLEIEFLLKDAEQLTSTAPANWDEVEAVVVNLATIDQLAFKVGRSPCPVDFQIFGQKTCYILPSTVRHKARTL